MLEGDDQERVQYWQVDLLRHVVGDPLRVVEDLILTITYNDRSIFFTQTQPGIIS